MKRADESAFPVPGMEGPNSNWIWPTCGLTIREHFAAMAMQGMLSGDGPWPASSTSARDLADNAVKVADALLAELAKVQK